MGRIVTSVTVANAKDPSRSITFDALVDTGASHLTLPLAWRDQLGELESRTVRMETATQQVVDAQLCGPVKVQVTGFPPTFTEVVFVDMEPQEAEYEPLLGYLVLEQSGIAVDMVGHRLMSVKHFDLKHAELSL